MHFFFVIGLFIDDSIAWYFLQQDNMYPAVNFNAFNPVDPATNDRIDVQADHAQYVSPFFSLFSSLITYTLFYN